MTFEETIAELESRPQFPPGPPKLVTVERGLERLGFFDYSFWERLRHDGKRVVLVAGTNGKGSTAVTLSELLRSAGERVGLYTSPHLQCTTERIRIDGDDVDPEHFCLAYQEVQEHTAGVVLTHFEMLTLMAVWLFASGEGGAPVDRMILEVGLGGIWDATNAVPHSAAIISSLGRDHQNLLGSGPKEIAGNKLGIIPDGGGPLEQETLVVHAPFSAAIEAAVAEARARSRSRWVESVPVQGRVEPGGDGEPGFVVATPWGEAPCALAGQRGAQNAALALTAFRELGYDPGAHLAVLGALRWPGRMERLDYLGRRVYLSGDHNPEGIASLLDLLPHYPVHPVRALVGVGVDKDLEGVLSPLFGLPESRIYLTETPFRGRSVDDYGPWLARAAAAVADPFEALGRALEDTPPGGALLVTGSIYLVGDLRKFMLGSNGTIHRQ